MALLPPQEVQDYVNEVKQVFADRYNSHAALKSPPHITLQPPFEWLETELAVLTQALSKFALQHLPIPIILCGFGAFPPRVVYINVQTTPELLALQTALMTEMAMNLGIIDPSSNTRSFAPHITVGFRDLTRENFRDAWAKFQPHPVQFEFTVANLTLLIHNDQRWTIYQEFPLARN